VVVAGGAVVVVVGSAGAVTVVTVVSTGAAVVELEEIAIVPGTVAVVEGAPLDVVSPTSVVVVVEVGGPMATGVSTTRSRMPATAADAINTESTVAPSQAAPMPKYRLIVSSIADGSIS
jgi:hypothetical protein